MTLPNIGKEFYLAIMPLSILIVGALFHLLQFLRPSWQKISCTAGILFSSIILSVVALFYNFVGKVESFLGATFFLDNLTVFLSFLILLVSLITAFFSWFSRYKERFFSPEIASIYLMTIVGLLTFVFSKDFITIFVGLELSSLGLYALAGYTYINRKSQEGALKYFVLGSFASSFLLLGMACLYISSGSMQMREIISSFDKNSGYSFITWIGCIALVVGIGFKLALVPFHMWAPDVYESAATPITFFMATSVKLMILSFAIQACILAQTTIETSAVFTAALLWLSALSTIVANVFGLVQANLKRLFAYSSVSHSGFLAIGLVVLARSSQMTEQVVESLILYIIAYVLMTVGVFSLILWFEEKFNTEQVTLDDLIGLSKQHPWICVTFATLLFSLAGLPPSLGFFAKFFIFSSAVSNQIFSPVVFGIIGSSIALFYYLRLIVKMFMVGADKDAHHGSHPHSESSAAKTVELQQASSTDIPIFFSMLAFICALVVVVFGVWLAPLREIVKVAARHILVK